MRKKRRGENRARRQTERAKKRIKELPDSKIMKPFRLKMPGEVREIVSQMPNKKIAQICRHPELKSLIDGNVVFSAAEEERGRRIQAGTQRERKP